VNAIKAAGTLPGLIWAVTRMVWWRLPDVLVRSEVPFDASPNTGSLLRYRPMLRRFSYDSRYQVLAQGITRGMSSIMNSKLHLCFL